MERLFGATPAWFVENDKSASAVLSSHYPDVPNLGDVTQIDWDSVSPVDVLTAGYPCQPFSHAGRRKGADDPRHLWPYARYAIGKFRPGIVILENVQGHLTKGGLEVVGSLAELGYRSRWGVVRAADAGAPHRRARIFIVAENVEVRQRWWGAVDAPALDFDGTPQELLPTPTPFTNGNRESPKEWLLRREDVISRTGTHHGLPLAVAARAISDGCPIRQSDPMASAAEVFAHTPAGLDYGPYLPAIQRWERVIGRPPPDPVVLDGKARRLSPRFAEWMMGWPQGWVDVGISIPQQLAICGNGVVPQQASLAIRVLGR